MAKNKAIDRLRDLIGKLNRTFSRQGADEQGVEEQGFYQAAPKKTQEHGQQDPPPQITGTRRRRTSDIPGNKAGGDKISGSYEAGGKAPSA